MSSQNQIDANRRNAESSTGPRTPEGKAVSRCNAFQSGIHAKSQVVPGEDPAELEALAEGYHRDWAPTSHFECFLVDSLVRADWLLRRLSRVEAETWTHEIQEARKSVFNKLDEEAPLGQIYGRTDDRYTRLQRRMDSAERSYYRAVTQLQRLRSGERPALEHLPGFDQTNPFPPGGIKLQPCPGEHGSPAPSHQTNPIPPKPAAQAGIDPYPHSARANRPSSGPCRPHQPPAHSRRPAAHTGCGSPAKGGSISVLPTVAGGVSVRGSGHVGVRR